MYNKASHAAKRVELEPPGQVSLYLSPTLTAGPFCNICLRFHTKRDDKVAPVLCHKYTIVLQCEGNEAVGLSADDSERNALFTRSPLCGASVCSKVSLLSHVVVADMLFYHLMGALAVSCRPINSTRHEFRLYLRRFPHIWNRIHISLRQRRNPQIPFRFQL